MADSVVVKTLFCACGVTTLSGSAVAGCLMLNVGNKREKEKRIVIPPLSAEGKKNADALASSFEKRKGGKLLIGNNSSSSGQKAGNRYRLANDSEGNDFYLKIKDYENRRNQEDIPDEFVDACSKASTSAIGPTHPLYLGVFLYCSEK